MTSEMERARLRVLADYAIMDTAPDEALDEIVQVAAAICDVPVALVSFVDETRQWFKAKTGLNANETPRDVAFCAQAIQSDDDVFTVRDARDDERFKTNPLVVGEPHVVFYAGAPLTVADGVKLGTLCVIDRRPRELTPSQRDALKKLSKAVVRYLETRKQALLREASDEFNRTVLASIGDAVIAADTNALVTYMNPVAEALTGWSFDEANGRPMASVFRLVNEHTRAVVESPVDRVLREGVVVGLANHTLLLRRDGREIPIVDSAAPIRAQGRAMSGVVLVFRDATETRALEDERTRLLAHAETERRKLFETFMQAPVAIAILEGPEHTFALANEPYRALVNGRDVIGKPLFEALPDVRDNSFVGLLDQVKVTGAPVHVTEAEVKFEHHHGDERLFLDFTCAPLKDPSGAINAVIAVVVDITALVKARRVAEEELAKSEFLLAVASALGTGLERRALLSQFLSVLVPARADFTSIWTVDAAQRMRREAFVPHGDEDVVNEQPEARHFPASFPIARVIQSRQPLAFDDLDASTESIGEEYAAIVRRRRLAHALFVPILREGDVVGVLAIARRRSTPFTAEERLLFASAATQLGSTLENVRLHTELGVMRDAAEAATLAKDDFLARVSHDLRNPLGAIVGWASLLKSGTSSSAQLARGLDVIERSANAQVQLIEDLLDVTRIASGKMRLNLALERVAPAMEAALEPARIAAERKGVSVDVAIDADVGSMVVDPDRFRQVIWNLASNSVKFTPAGRQVRVRARRESSALEIVVADDGKGIAPAFLPRVFGAFEQAGDASNRTAGLGLGLSIVHHIVELHGGAITATSDGEDKGATFTVRLPIRTSAWSPAQSSSAVDPPMKKLGGVTVVTVDDEEEAREIITAILEAAGATVVSASSADEALACIRARRPDVLVSDINMPEKDGRALIRELRGYAATDGGQIPAVALTALARSRDRVEAIAAGFNTHVPKPVDANELVMVIVGLLDR
ncbi:MAG: PAS domain-containing protein [Labilithrix sp.]|nr:PAS domain-containing protein [Labilithrix sp.]MCW5813804.1 PAS domain-containing protein [Labilithrix sp.]